MHPFRAFLLITLGKADAFDKTPTSRDWEIIYRMARQQTLLGVLFDGIARLREEQRPPQAMYDEWAQLASRIPEIHATHERHVGELSGILEGLGLRGCILKGTALSHLYPVPEHRMCGDIDLWVRGTHRQILKTLDGAGYPVWNVLYQECKVGFFDDTVVEVHFHPSKMYNPFHNARLQRCLEALSPIRDEGPLTEPDARFNAIFCMAHMYRHYLEGGLGLRQMMDYYYVLQRLSPDDREPVMRRLKKLGMGRFTAAMMLSLQYNFGLEDEYLLCPPDRKLGRKLIEDAIAMGNFGILDKRNRPAAGEGPLKRFIRKNKRVFSNFKYYPGEVLWSPYARIHQFVWRLFNQYI